MALAKIREARGRGVVVSGDDIDTDRIIPARYLKCVTFDGLGEALFHDERFDETGRRKGHPIDDPRHAGAAILITGDNFGCGSSREHAPQAIQRAGIRGIVAGSFAEIFFGNATTLGLVCARVGAADRADVSRRVAEDPTLEVIIDVDAQEVRVGDARYPADIGASAREALLSGYWDPIGELLEGSEQVSAVAKALGHRA